MVICIIIGFLLFLSFNNRFCFCFQQLIKFYYIHRSSPATTSPASARPDRLISKLKTQMSNIEGPRLVVVRQPLRPDGNSKGFAPRVSRQNIGKCEPVA